MKRMIQVSRVKEHRDEMQFLGEVVLRSMKNETICNRRREKAIYLRSTEIVPVLYEYAICTFLTRFLEAKWLSTVLGAQGIGGSIMAFDCWPVFFIRVSSAGWSRRNLPALMMNFIHLFLKFHVITAVFEQGGKSANQPVGSHFDMVTQLDALEVEHWPEGLVRRGGFWVPQDCLKL